LALNALEPKLKAGRPLMTAALSWGATVLSPCVASFPFPDWSA